MDGILQIGDGNERKGNEEWCYIVMVVSYKQDADSVVGNIAASA